LRRYLHTQTSGGNHLPLTAALHRSLDELGETQALGPADPREVTRVPTLRESFRYRRQQDAHELLQKLLNGLQDEAGLSSYVPISTPKDSNFPSSAPRSASPSASSSFSTPSRSSRRPSSSGSVSIAAGDHSRSQPMLIRSASLASPSSASSASSSSSASSTSSGSYSWAASQGGVDINTRPSELPSPFSGLLGSDLKCNSWKQWGGVFFLMFFFFFCFFFFVHLCLLDSFVGFVFPRSLTYSELLFSLCVCVCVYVCIRCTCLNAWFSLYLHRTSICLYYLSLAVSR
jgi:hypothetical protein